MKTTKILIGLFSAMVVISVADDFKKAFNSALSDKGDTTPTPSTDNVAASTVINDRVVDIDLPAQELTKVIASAEHKPVIGSNTMLSTSVSNKLIN